MSREDVIRKIVERDIQQQGLSEDVVRRESPQLHTDACEFYGTWSTALQYSGISGRRATKNATEESTLKPIAIQSNTYRIGADLSPKAVINMICRLCDNGYSLSAEKTMSRDPRLYDAAHDHFGSWDQALTSSGVNPENIRMIWNKSMSRRDQLIEAMQHRHGLSKSLTIRAVSRDNFGLYDSVRSVFGSWKRGLLAAGLIEPSQLGRSLSLDQKQVIEAICKRKKDGRSLSSSVVAKEDAILIYSARIYYNTWRGAIEIALQSDQGL